MSWSSYPASLHLPGGHDDDTRVLLVHHGPESSHCSRQTALGGDVHLAQSMAWLLLWVTLKEGGVSCLLFPGIQVPENQFKLMQMICKVAQVAHTWSMEGGRGLGPIFNPAVSGLAPLRTQLQTAAPSLSICCLSKVHRPLQELQAHYYGEWSDQGLIHVGHRCSRPSTHPDVVGVDVVGSRHSVIHITKDDTSGIN